jgi:hypothetical protein
VPTRLRRGQLDDRAAPADIERLLISNRNLSRRAEGSEQEFKRIAAGGMRGFVKKT